MLKKQLQRNKRHRRIRAKIHGAKKCPRLCVFRSNQYIYAQIIDDDSGRVLVYARGLKNSKGAEEAGKKLAKAALDKKITKVVFDRGGYKYHGRISSLAKGAREGGLKF